jgi:hypothetical protein
MMKVSCPTCGVRLTAPEDLLGKPVNCQKCNTKFVLSRRWMNEPLMVSTEFQIPEKAEGYVPAEAKVSLLGNDSSEGSSDPVSALLESIETPGSSSEKTEIPSAETSSSLPGSPAQYFLTTKTIATEPIMRAARPLSGDVPDLAPEAESRDSLNLNHYRESDSILDFFDFRFRRYLTPGIVRISWFLILLATSLWLVLLSYFYLTSIIQRTGFVFPEVLNRSLETRETSDHEMVFAIPAFFYKSALFFTYLIATLIVLLWMRVFFETVMMVFNVGSYLREAKFRPKKK